MFEPRLPRRVGILATAIVLALAIGACADHLSIGQPSAASQSSIPVREDGTTQTLSCQQSSVVISGHHNAITLTGACADVSVSGDDNRVSIVDTARLSVPGDYNTLTVQRVDSIRLDGHHNQLTYQSGMTRSQPTTINHGERNVLTTGNAR